jgi:hypothetical protein
MKYFPLFILFFSSPLFHPISYKYQFQYIKHTNTAPNLPTMLPSIHPSILYIHPILLSSKAKRNPSNKTQPQPQRPLVSPWRRPHSWPPYPLRSLSNINSRRVPPLASHGWLKLSLDGTPVGSLLYGLSFAGEERRPIAGTSRHWRGWREGKKRAPV